MATTTIVTTTERVPRHCLVLLVLMHSLRSLSAFAATTDGHNPSKNIVSAASAMMGARGLNGLGPNNMVSTQQSSDSLATNDDDDTSSNMNYYRKQQQQPQVLDPLVVCGPSGVGKGSIISKFMTERAGHRSFGFTVSHTTRYPRDGEVHGIHYHFCSREQMAQLRADNFFVETAHVHGNEYGTSWQAMLQVQEQGKKCLLDIDVQGVQRLKEHANNNNHNENSNSNTTAHTIMSMTNGRILWQPKYIFIAPPSLQALESRLIGRGSESAESLQRRMGNARAEVEYGLAPGNFDQIVVNDDLEQAVLDFERAVWDLYEEP